MLDRKTFFDRVRANLFGGFLSGAQVSGMSAILDAWERCSYTDPRWLAYCLATTYHETRRTMQPIPEDGRGRGHPYGVPDPKTGQTYYGRGFVQLTHRANYVTVTGRLHDLGMLDHSADLSITPALALDPVIAADILIVGCCEGWFSGSSLRRWFSPTVDDPVQARRVVNVLDRAQDIAGYHRMFLAAVRAASSQSTPSGPVSTPSGPQSSSELHPPATAPAVEPQHIDVVKAQAQAAKPGLLGRIWGAITGRAA